MKPSPHQILQRLFSGGVLLLVCLLPVATARAQSLYIGSHIGVAGGGVRVPVLVSNVPSLAAAALTLNYDLQVLTLTNVRSGSLGAFSVEYLDAGGSARLVAVQLDALTNASGSCAVLEFVVKPGVPAGTVSPLTIADRSLSGDAGKQLEWSSVITHTDGSFTVVSAALDSDADGLPDWWEDTYFGGPTSADPSADSDGDGVTDGSEYQLGTDPRNPADPLRIQSVSRSAGTVTLRFYSLLGQTYTVEKCEVLGAWSDLSPDVAGTGGMVEVLDTNSAPSESFYRLRSP